ncbi:MAG TPA: hypothetical protein VJ396_04525 [Acidiferrobacterales bacterium]|nr:hypothetical protein [Acidiferrobacterales bacterium]
MRTVLNWLAEPRHLNRLLAITLRVLAALIVPFSLVTFFKAGKVIFDLPASGILGGIVFQMFFVLAIYAVVHGLFIRARNIDALPGGEYNMFPLAALLVRAAGEAIAAFISLVAVGGGIYVWFTGKGVGTILNPPPKFLPLFGDTTFMGGIEFMVGGVLSAILVVVITYLAVEGLQLLTEAAGRMQASRRTTSEPSEPSLPSEPSVRLRSGTGL